MCDHRYAALQLYEIWQPSCYFLPGRTEPHSPPTSRSIAAITLKGTFIMRHGGFVVSMTTKEMDCETNFRWKWFLVEWVILVAEFTLVAVVHMQETAGLRRIGAPDYHSNKARFRPSPQNLLYGRWRCVGIRTGNAMIKSCRSQLARQTRTSTCQSKNNRRYIPLPPRPSPWVAPILVCTWMGYWYQYCSSWRFWVWCNSVIKNEQKGKLFNPLASVWILFDPN